MLIGERLRRAFEEWKAKDVTSNRMFGTGIALAVIGVPFSLWFLVVGPTAGDRLVSFGFLVVTLVLAVYSLWEAKNLNVGRSDPDDRRP